LILSNVLKTVRLLIGDHILLEKYHTGTQKILRSPSSNTPTLLVYQERALYILEGHLKEFEPRLDKQKEENPFFNIKQELYRLPNMLLSALADYYNISEGNTWDKIAALEKLKIISPDGAKNLCQAMDNILHLTSYISEPAYICITKENVMTYSILLCNENG
jgi:hypothetical protein